MNRSLLSRVLSGLLAALLFSQAAMAAPPEVQTGDTASFEAAIRGSIRSRGEAPFLIFDTGITRLTLSPGGEWGTAWIYPLDPDSGEALPGEPGLVVGLRRGQTWRVVFPADPDWQAVVREAPDTLLSAAEKEDWLLRYSTSLSLNTTNDAPIGGFLLPWARGLKIILTRSILHYNPPNPDGSMHYSFDFAHPWVNGSSPMFNLYASKTGVVKYARWVQFDNDHASPGNYLVVEDTSTTPTTFHVYLHLGFDSIPIDLRVKGAPVYQGQYIGKAGNTGFSTGNHLHFQVHTNPTSYWGTAVDITFDDVAINGGRPRMETEAKYFPIYGSEWQKGNAFYSENDVRADFIPPSGGILQPTMGSKITSASMRVEGWARDDQSGLYSTHVLANWGSGWQTVAGPFSGMTFSANVDLCTRRVPDGPFSVALRVQDWENNLSPELTGLSHYIKEYTCPPVPACVPQPGEAALFAEKDFRGSCQVFPAGTYTTTQITLTQVESLRVGSGAQAVLFQNPDGTGRAETFFASDSSLGDNRIGAGAFGALRVAPAAAVPLAPQPTWPLTGTSFTTNDSLSLAWEDRGGGQRFTVAITGPISHTITVTGTAAASLAGLNLPAGSYTWRVQAGNAFTSTLSAPSAVQTFSISAAASSPVITSTLPVTFSMESDAGWVKTPFWRLDSQANYSESGGLGWAYRQVSPTTYLNNPVSANAGSLTSPAILIPPEGAVAQFRYRYQTEGRGLHWDRRWVQVSANSGPFENLLQLAEDQPDFWQLSPELDLSAYKGQVVRLRFHFETLDASFNSFSGWEIDDLAIRPGAGRVCSDLAGSTHTSARSILIGTSQSEMICPAGDVDFYTFTANAGETIEAFTTASPSGSTLDTVLYLLDSDGQSVLAENDDVRTGVLPDSALSYTFSRTGTYYLKVRSWHHPSLGDESAFYTLSLRSAVRPAVSLTVPAENSFLPITPFTLTAALSDAGSGPLKVAFYVHSASWKTRQWLLLGEDTDGTDGWSLPVNLSTLPEGDGIGFYALGYDAAGLTSAAGAWGLISDHTPPVTALQPITTPTATAVKLTWTAFDNVSGINLTSIQSRTGSAAWEDWFATEEALTSTWLVGEFGKTYGFRMAARDAAGNWEAYPSTAEVIAALPNSCTPDAAEGEAGNNSPDTAVIVTERVTTHTFNFCNPAADSGLLYDEDWLRFVVPAGQALWVQVRPISAAAAVWLQLYGNPSLEDPELAESRPEGFGLPSALVWKAGETEQTVYLRLRHLDGRVAGSGTSFTVSATVGYPIWLPLMTR